MSDRSSQRELMARKREAEQSIEIAPFPADPDRRVACEADDKLFLTTYFPHRFYNPWNEDHDRILSEINDRIQHGGDKAVAAPRSSGKTSIAECRIGVKAVVTGELSFPLIVAATGPHAEQILDNIKREYDDCSDVFAEDYPEVCGPIRALEHSPARCRKQKHKGEFTNMRWSGDRVVFPTVWCEFCPTCYRPGKLLKAGLKCMKCRKYITQWKSKAAGAILRTAGLDAAIRGIRVGEKRPDFVLIDDPDTAESARSYKQTGSRIAIINNDIAGLGGEDRRIPRLMTTTIQTTMSASAHFTDRKLSPAWIGDRMKLVKRWPDAKQLWEEYIEIRKKGMQDEPPDASGRVAHAFYLANRDKMDEGASVSNPNRFCGDILEDGTQFEVSTIQAVHNAAADNGWDYVFCELQNDPPEEEIGEEDNLTVGIVTGTHQEYAGRLVDGKGVPIDAECVTCFVDVQHDRLWYVVVAHLQGDRTQIVSYGVEGMHIKTHEIGTHDATVQRLHAMNDRLLAGVNPDLVCVDCADGTTRPAVFEACLALGWMPTRGESPYRHPQSKTKQQQPGMDRSTWRQNIQREGPRRIRVTTYDVDWHKHQCRDAWRINPASPGGCVLYGDAPGEHLEFGRQMTCEKFRREFIEGKGWKEYWHATHKDNHYFDCSVGNILARSLWRKSAKRTERTKLSDVASKKKPAATPSPAKPVERRVVESEPKKRLKLSDLQNKR